MNTYPETLVARVTGIRKRTLAHTRRTRLYPETDWVLLNSVVHYTPAGLTTLLTHHQLDANTLTWPAAPLPEDLAENTPETTNPMPTTEPPLTPAEKIAADARAVEARPIYTLRVAELSRNPTLIYATRADTSERVTVRVRTNQNFLPGMPIHARHPANPTDPWRMEGNCPRWRGRY
jgi:hypothetical protein